MASGERGGEGVGRRCNRCLRKPLRCQAKCLSAFHLKCFNFLPNLLGVGGHQVTEKISPISGYSCIPLGLASDY
jgi:hypothetical protein